MRAPCLRVCRGTVISPAFSRSVAQSGSAPRSGRGGRRFKSCHSDQFPAVSPQAAIGLMSSAGPTTRVLPAGAAALAEAVRCLAAGGLVAFPTETVYGLGADAANGAAVARLYAAKGRPAFNPLIAHVADAAAARRLAQFDQAADRLAALWPGPLTLVLPKTLHCSVADLATAGLDTIALRVPSHAIAHDILARFGKPIVAPSANQSGHVSPTTATHVRADLAGAI